MSDVLTKAQRRYNMSRIRGRDTQPEMAIRRGLHVRGLRFRLYRKDLPGCPDLVFPKHRVVIFVHGCFWHGHGCSMFVLPKTRKEFWLRKIKRNQYRDQNARKALRYQEWRVLTIWECSFKGPRRRSLNDVLDECESFVLGKVCNEMEILGEPNDAGAVQTGDECRRFPQTALDAPRQGEDTAAAAAKEPPSEGTDRP